MTAREEGATLVAPAAGQPPIRFVFGQCCVDVARREVRLHGRTLRVEPKIFDLLVYLLEHRARVVSREELKSKVWRGAPLSASALARAIMKVRRAVGQECIDVHGVIRTYHRVGYRFCVPESELEMVETALSG
jgi:DNA-binding winged helix-turn-helix (wHTH) protein